MLAPIPSVSSSTDDRLTHAFEQLLRRRHDALPHRRPDVRQNGELVATQAGDKSIWTDALRQPRTEVAQQHVTVVMPEGVVDLLEPVEVEKHDSKRFRRNPCACNFLLR